MPKGYVDGKYKELVQLLETQLSEERAQVTELRSLLGIHPFNSTGWTHSAHILVISVLTNMSYTNGLGTPGNMSQEWIIPCQNLTNYSVMALVMGSVVDYYRPTNGSSVCDMLTSYNKHQWTNWEMLQFSYWWTPAYYDSNHLGGSSDGWPQTLGWNRRFLSFWGSTIGYLGGCCSTTYTQSLSIAVPSCSGPRWCQAFDMYWH